MIHNWVGYPINKHFWAFYYFLKRNGDSPYLIEENGKVIGVGYCES